MLCTESGSAAYTKMKTIALEILMRKIAGLIIFFMAIGMLLMLVIHNRLTGLLIIALLLFAGYNCFCDD